MRRPTDKEAEEAIRVLLRYIGEDPNRPGLRDTPARVCQAWRREWARGYGQRPNTILKTFKDGADRVDEMVVLRDLDLYSHCEHHLAPFFGSAHLAYVPDGKIVGLSKLARLVEIFSRRLQVQERLTNQIADALMDHLQPKGVGVVISARHMCMHSRGVRHSRSVTVTSALRGCMKDESSAREEFLRLCRTAV